MLAVLESKRRAGANDALLPTSHHENAAPDIVRLRLATADVTYDFL
jgi:hypothetical protein